MVLSEFEWRVSGLTSSESRDRGRFSSVGKGSEDLSVNVRVTDAVFDLEVSSSNDLRSVGNGSESLERSSGSGLNDSFAFNEVSKFFTFRDFVVGSTTAHHIVLKGFGKNKLYTSFNLNF